MICKVLSWYEYRSKLIKDNEKLLSYNNYCCAQLEKCWAEKKLLSERLYAKTTAHWLNEIEATRKEIEENIERLR